MPFGIGSAIKDTWRKAMPNEVSELMGQAAPIVSMMGPMGAILGAGMAWNSEFDRTGRMGSSLKKAGKTFVTGKVGQAVGGQFGGAENVGIKSLGDPGYWTDVGFNITGGEYVPYSLSNAGQAQAANIEAASAGTVNPTAIDARNPLGTPPTGNPMGAPYNVNRPSIPPGRVVRRPIGQPSVPGASGAQPMGTMLYPEYYQPTTIDPRAGATGSLEGYRASMTPKRGLYGDPRADVSGSLEGYRASMTPPSSEPYNVDTGYSWDPRDVEHKQVQGISDAEIDTTNIEAGGKGVDGKELNKKFTERLGEAWTEFKEAEGFDKAKVAFDFMMDPANQLVVQALGGTLAAVAQYLENKANEEDELKFEKGDLAYNREYRDITDLSTVNPTVQLSKNGGIIGLANGGEPTMEMDYRGGGFIPVGAKERADDVPARLSKNEFVMTADAVRAAGGGSVDVGAQRMYNLMNRLEAVA
jgi:hypothetical protein